MQVQIEPRVRRSVETLARAGYAAKGVVYAIIGVLAAQAALGAGGEVGGTKNALGELGDAPFGKALLLVVGAGLLGYVGWRTFEALADPERRGTDAKGLALRAGYLGSALTYLGLAIAAFADALRGPGSTDDSKAGAVGRALGLPLGEALVAAGGVAVMAFGAWQLYVAFQGRFVRHYDRARMTARQLAVATRLGQLGLAARGLTFLAMGGFLVAAGMEADPGRAYGLGGTLTALARQPGGQVLLPAVAIGLVAYGAYCLSEAQWRVIRTAG